VVRRVAVVLAAGSALCIAMGICFELTQSDDLLSFDLDAERTWAAGWSAFMLFLGVIAALWAFRAAALGWPSLAMALLLSIAVVDEWTEIHERIRTYTTAVAWQWFYAPLLLLGAAAVIATVRRVDVPLQAKVLLLGGTVSWIAAQVIELVQWSTTALRVDSPVLVVLEEAFEMTGTALIVLSLVAIATNARPTGARTMRAPPNL